MGRPLRDPVVTSRQMRSRARPRPVPRPLRQSGATRVEFDIAGRCHQVRLIHRRRGETALPQIARPALAQIDPPGIAPVRLGQRRPQAVDVIGHKDQVNMVGHQAIGPDRDAGLATAFGQQGLVGGIVVVGEKGGLPAVAPLRHVMGHALDHHSRQPRHDGRLGAGVHDVNKI